LEDRDFKPKKAWLALRKKVFDVPEDEDLPYDSDVSQDDLDKIFQLWLSDCSAQHVEDETYSVAAKLRYGLAAGAVWFTALECYKFWEGVAWSENSPAEFYDVDDGDDEHAREVALWGALLNICQPSDAEDGEMDAEDAGLEEEAAESLQNQRNLFEKFGIEIKCRKLSRGDTDE